MRLFTNIGMTETQAFCSNPTQFKFLVLFSLRFSGETLLYTTLRQGAKRGEMHILHCITLLHYIDYTHCLHCYNSLHCHNTYKPFLAIKLHCWWLGLPELNYMLCIRSRLLQLRSMDRHEGFPIFAGSLAPLIGARVCQIERPFHSKLFLGAPKFDCSLLRFSYSLQYLFEYLNIWILSSLINHRKRAIYVCKKWERKIHLPIIKHKDIQDKKAEKDKKWIGWWYATMKKLEKMMIMLYFFNKTWRWRIRDELYLTKAKDKSSKRT